MRDYIEERAIHIAQYIVDNGATVRLNLNGNNASAVSGDEYFLEENAGSFSVVDVANVDTNNGGEVNFSPNQAAFNNDPGGIPTP